MPIDLTLAHSPDADDAFMWWPLMTVDGAPPRLGDGDDGACPVGGRRFRFTAVMEDIEALNLRSDRAELEITALSCAQYARVRERYALTACGASLGDAYGPRLVAREAIAPERLTDGEAVIAVPGERTSAFGALSLMLGPGRFRYEVVPFQEIVGHVVSGASDAGLVIHEAQLTFGDAGLELVADLGAWWTGRTNLPLPLGVNAIRRDLEDVHGPGTLAAVTTLLRRSVEYALEHRDESVRYALRFAGDVDRERADAFIRMYVNRWTLDFGNTGRAAVAAFLDALQDAGLVPAAGRTEFIDPVLADRVG